jgi:hypothetical protein
MADLGSDFAGVADLDANLSIVTGRRCLIENLARRTCTQKGGMLDDPTYGEPVHDLVGDVFDEIRYAQKLEQQFLDDERVDEAGVTATYNEATREARLDCVVDDGDGPFELTIAVSDLTVEILEPKG